MEASHEQDGGGDQTATLLPQPESEMKLDHSDDISQLVIDHSPSPIKAEGMDTINAEQPDHQLGGSTEGMITGAATDDLHAVPKVLEQEAQAPTESSRIPTAPNDTNQKIDVTSGTTGSSGSTEESKPPGTGAVPVAVVPPTAVVNPPTTFASASSTRRSSSASFAPGRRSSTAYNKDTPTIVANTNPGALNPLIPIAFNNHPNGMDTGISGSNHNNSSNNNKAASRSGNNNNGTTNSNAIISNETAAAALKLSSTAPSATSNKNEDNANNGGGIIPTNLINNTAATSNKNSRGRTVSGGTAPQLLSLHSSKQQVQAKLMEPGYTPHIHDVLCGRGRSCKIWQGNQDYRLFVASKLDAYSHANSKLEKGFILSEIVTYVRTKDPPGHFIKKDKAGNWYEVGDFQAREKTSQAFRDALSEQYSSSAQAKYNRRKKRESSAAGVGNDESISQIGPTGSPNNTKRVDTLLHLRPGDASVARIHASLKAQQQGETGSSMGGLGTEDATPFKKQKTQWQNPCNDAQNEDNRRPIEDDVATVLQNMASNNSSDTSPSKDDTIVNVCALQLRMRSSDESPMIAAQHAIDRMSTVASTSKVDIFVLPELAPLGYSEDTFARFLPSTPQNQQLLQNIDDIFAYQAKRLNSYICYGTIGWNEASATTAGDKPQYFIRQVVLDRTGNNVASYDKIHLCDYGNCRETRFFTPGPLTPVSFTVGQFRFGLLICADIRYAKLARILARDHKVDVLLQPSAFVRDISFRTWQSFRETRAVENSVYFVAVNYAGDKYGGSSVVKPWVDETHEPEVLGTGEGFLMGGVSRNTLTSVRTNLPFHRHLMADDDYQHCSNVTEESSDRNETATHNVIAAKNSVAL